MRLLRGGIEAVEAVKVRNRGREIGASIHRGNTAMFRCMRFGVRFVLDYFLETKKKPRENV
jgi:hypothetical protein